MRVSKMGLIIEEAAEMSGIGQNDARRQQTRPRSHDYDRGR